MVQFCCLIQKSFSVIHVSLREGILFEKRQEAQDICVETSKRNSEQDLLEEECTADEQDADDSVVASP